MIEKKYPWQLTTDEIPYYETAIEVAVGLDEDHTEESLVSEEDVLLKDLDTAINLISSHILNDLMQLWTWNLPEQDSVGVWITQVSQHMNGTKTYFKHYKFFL